MAIGQSYYIGHKYIINFLVLQTSIGCLERPWLANSERNGSLGQRKILSIEIYTLSLFDYGIIIIMIRTEQEIT